MTSSRIIRRELLELIQQMLKGHGYEVRDYETSLGIIYRTTDEGVKVFTVKVSEVR